MEKEKLAEILKNHESWLRGEGGERADLSETDLRNANLSYADLRNANLSYADLRNANLRNANLSYANLSSADLRNANLRNADLSSADLRNANLSEMILQVGPIGSRKSYTVYFADRDYVQCGCWNDGEGNHLEAFKKRVEAVYPTGQYHDEYMAVIAMFEKFKEMNKEGKDNGN